MRIGRSYEEFLWQTSPGIGNTILKKLERTIIETPSSFRMTELIIVNKSSSQLVCANIYSEDTKSDIVNNVREGKSPFLYHRIVFQLNSNSSTTVLKVSSERTVSFDWFLRLITLFPCFAIIFGLICWAALGFAIGSLSSLGYGIVSFSLTIEALILNTVGILLLVGILFLCYRFFFTWWPFAIFFTGIRKDIVKWLLKTDPEGYIILHEGRSEQPSTSSLINWRSHFQREKLFHILYCAGVLTSTIWWVTWINYDEVKLLFSINGDFLFLFSLLNAFLFSNIAYLAHKLPIDKSQPIAWTKRILKEGLWITIGSTVGLVLVLSFVTAFDRTMRGYERTLASSLEEVIGFFFISGLLSIFINLMVFYYNEPKDAVTSHSKEEKRNYSSRRVVEQFMMAKQSQKEDWIDRLISDVAITVVFFVFSCMAFGLVKAILPIPLKEDQFTIIILVIVPCIILYLLFIINNHAKTLIIDELMSWLKLLVRDVTNDDKLGTKDVIALLTVFLYLAFGLLWFIFVHPRPSLLFHGMTLLLEIYFLLLLLSLIRVEIPLFTEFIRNSSIFLEEYFNKDAEEGNYPYYWPILLLVAISLISFWLYAFYSTF